MRVLKKKVMKEGIVKELRARQYYQKPSEIKREKKKEGIKNFKKKMKNWNNKDRIPCLCL
jgi:small subunit ribosomal protein S21